MHLGEKIVQTVNIQVVVLHISEDTVTLMCVCVCVCNGNKETNSSYIEDWSGGKLSLKTLHR